MNGMDLTFEGAKIVFRNFAGVGNQFNREGARNFSIVIPSLEAAMALYEAGWNVGVKAQKQEDKDAIKAASGFKEKVQILSDRGVLDEALFHLKTTVNFNSKKPAEIFLVTEMGRKPLKLDENTVAQLDLADIVSCDIIVSPYAWTSPRGSGITAYLKTMYVLIRQDPFAAKYAYNEEE